MVQNVTTPDVPFKLPEIKGVHNTSLPYTVFVTAVTQNASHFQLTVSGSLQLTSVSFLGAETHPDPNSDGDYILEHYFGLQNISAPMETRIALHFTEGSQLSKLLYFSLVLFRPYVLLSRLYVHF